MQNKVRIIVGPNGSGKSTIKKILADDFKLNMGYFVNADEIEKKLNSNLKLENILKITDSEKNNFILNHTLNNKFNLKKLITKLVFTTSITLKNYKINSYEAAVIADLFRVHSLKNKINFSFESVFSDTSKINFVKQLKRENYKIYLYVVSTLNPEINKSRVKQRVLNNGHPVTDQKIEERYYKSLTNIKKIIPISNRAYIIDNSQQIKPMLVAEIDNGKTIIYKNETYQPDWVKKLVGL